MCHLTLEDSDINFGWKNHHVNIECQVYPAIVLSILLMGAETWRIY